MAGPCAEDLRKTYEDIVKALTSLLDPNSKSLRSHQDAHALVDLRIARQNFFGVCDVLLHQVTEGIEGARRNTELNSVPNGAKMRTVQDVINEQVRFTKQLKLVIRQSQERKRHVTAVNDSDKRLKAGLTSKTPQDALQNDATVYDSKGQGPPTVLPDDAQHGHVHPTTNPLARSVSRGNQEDLHASGSVDGHAVGAAALKVSSGLGVVDDVPAQVGSAKRCPETAVLVPANFGLPQAADLLPTFLSEQSSADVDKTMFLQEFMANDTGADIDFLANFDSVPAPGTDRQ